MSTSIVAAAETSSPVGERILRAREAGILLFTVYLVLFLYWYTGETFWTPQNLLNVARNVSFVALMAIGLLWVAERSVGFNVPLVPMAKAVLGMKSSAAT